MRRIVLSVLIALILGCSSHASSPVVLPAPAMSGKSVQPDSITFVKYGVGDVHAMALGHDGNVWFIGDRSTTFGRITLTGQITYGTLPAAASGITANPDGNIYIATVGCVLYQVHPDMTFVSLPYSCTSPGGSIVSGYDGRIWIVDATSTITRVSTTGEVSTLQMPEPMYTIMRGNSTGRAMFGQGESVDGPFTYYRIAPDDSITSAPMYMGLTTVARDGMIWGFHSAIDRNQPQFMVRMADDLTFTEFPVSDKVSAVAVLSRASLILMPAPITLKIFRFSITKDSIVSAWPNPGQDVTAIIGPNRTLWVSTGRDVYIGTIK